jgi:two-component system phosphate regulon sensor histidine kinase PhoR
VRRRTTSLAGRLTGVMVLLVALILLVGLTGSAAILLVSSRQDRVSQFLTPSVFANSEAVEALVDAETGVRGFLLGGRQLLAPYRGSRDRADAALDRVERLAGDVPGVRELVVEQQSAADAWYEEYAEPATDGGSVPSPLRSQALLDRFRDANDQLDQLLRNERQRVLDEAGAIRSAGVAVVVALALLAAAVGGGSAVRAVRWTVVPIARLRRVVERLRMGESAARARTDEGPAEVRSVARAVNTLADDADRLRAEREEAARLRQLAADTGRAVRSELDANAAALAAVTGLGEAISVDHVWVRLVEGGAAVPSDPGDHADFGPVPASWSRPGAEPMALPSSEVVTVRETWHLWVSGEVRAVENTRRSALMRTERAQPFVQQTDATALLTAPVASGDAVLGVLTLVCTRAARTFSAAETTTVRAVAADLALALEHAALFEQQLELVDRLQELDRQKSDFLSTVSHELRTPLTSIAGYTEMIRDGDAGEVAPAVDRMLEVVTRNTERLRALIEDLLTLSRIESGNLRSASVPVEVRTLLDAAVTAVAPHASSARVQVDVEAPPTGTTVLGDELQLERVVLNLLSNAVKFTPAGRSVRLGARVADGEVVLTCTDEGIGIPQAEQEHLFDRFFRASNATARAIPGTGLGLVIVRGVVEQHGGSISLESAEGEGTTVTVRLPALVEG